MTAARCRREFLNISVYDTYMFEAEKTYDEIYADDVTDWLADKWTYTVWIGAAYVITIFTLKIYMANRPKFDLRLPLALWSATLAFFSFFGMIRTVPELVFVLTNHGYQVSVCNPANMFGPTALWQMLITASKSFELGDTIFIVLRKQPLMFLHWYHHLTVLMYGAFAYADLTAAVRWFAAMNFTIHTFMYSYYALRACKVPVPKIVNVVITSAQLLQMVSGLIATVMVAYYKSAGYPCQMSDANVKVAGVIYFSYLILFANFFYKSYVKPSAPKAADRSKSEKKTA